MIASVLVLSRADCKALRITDPYSIHRVVYSLFPKKDGTTREFLFADRGGSFNERTILLLSEDEPEKPEYGELRMKKIPENFLQQNSYGFDVLVNPVRRDSKTGKIIPVRGMEALREWFINKVPSYGFNVESESLSVSDTEVLKFTKDGQNVILGKARFIGKLEVFDHQRFIDTFKHGLGKAKGFGYGLLQIIPLKKAAVNA